jgi:hypothetical protein
MLPFLKNKQDASGSSSEPIIREPDEGAEEYDSLHTAMEELGGHLASKDWAAAAECFKAAFQLCEEEPHEEGEHT